MKAKEVYGTATTLVQGINEPPPQHYYIYVGDKRE